MLFTYEDLQNYISLNTEDENTDRMLLTSSYNTLKKILNFELEERNYTELHTVTDYKIITEQINIIEIKRYDDTTENLEYGESFMRFRKRDGFLVTRAAANIVILKTAKTSS